MNYDIYGKYTLQDAKEKLKLLNKDYIELSIKRDKLYKKNLPEQQFDKRKFELDSQMLLLGYEIDAEEWKRIIASINVAQKDKLFKASTKRQQQRLIHNNRAHNNVLQILENPLINGSYKKLMEDTKSIRILSEFINIIKRENQKNLDPEIAEVFKIVAPIMNEYSKAIRGVEQQLDSLLNEIKVSLEQKQIRRGEELSAFIKDMNSIKSYNRLEYKVAEDYSESRDKVNSIHKVSLIKSSLENVPTDIGIDTSIIRDNLKTVNLVEIIEKMESMINTIEGSIPKIGLYGSARIDFSALHDTIRNVERLLNSRKELNETKLEENGYNRELHKVKDHEIKNSLIRQLAREYEKLTPDLKGSVRQEIENNIEALTANTLFDENELYMIKMEAQKQADYVKEDKEIKKITKFHEEEKRNNRAVAMKNREGVSQDEIERITIEAELEAYSRYPESNILKSGEVHDLNEDERQKFIEHYIDQKLSNLSAYKFDEEQREKNSNDLISAQNYEIIANEGITEDMIRVSAELLGTQDVIKNADVASLSPSDLNKVLNNAKIMKSYVGLDGFDLAKKMVEDRTMNKAEDLNMGDVIVQYNLNNMHNIAQKINLYFGNINIKK